MSELSARGRKRAIWRLQRRMEWPKVKNIIILLLLMVNAFLLVLVLGQRRTVDRYARSVETKAVQVLEQNGITVTGDVLEQGGALPSALSAPRDLEAEKILAQALLGQDVLRSDQSGGLYAYESERGTALFRASGDFDVHFEHCALDGRQPAVHAAALLADMGLEGELVAAPEGQGGEVTVLQTVNGAPVYSCRLTFEYSDSEFVRLSGTLLTGAAQPLAEGTASLDLANALIRFLDGILDRGSVCSSITGLRPGYRVTQTFGTDLRLAPTWLVTTNAGSYYMDGATGTLEPVG